MSWTLPANATFTVDEPKAEVFAPAGGWNDKIAPKSPWQTSPTVAAPRPSYQDDEGLKQQFGIELAKASNPFEAACKIFVDTSQALWASTYWLADPLVIASRDIYLKTVELNQPPLDRNQLLAKVLALADENILINGVLRPTIEAKDRVAALKLYSEIQGYTGKVEIDNSVTNNTLNEMTIKLVRADDKKSVTIDHAPNVKSEILNDSQPSPITLKLVKAG
jgi:hypothetical protein